jgi:hypothetical protein
MEKKKMGAFFKNFSLFMSGLGCLLLPLAWYVYPMVIIPVSVTLFVGGMYISYYYHIRDIHVNEFVFKFGQPIFVAVYALVLWKLSLPLITVPIGVVLFVVIIVAIQLFRKYILGICDSCRCDIDKK